MADSSGKKRRRRDRHKANRREKRDALLVASALVNDLPIDWARMRGAVTGRISSLGPNLQNIPRQGRSMFNMQMQGLAADMLVNEMARYPQKTRLEYVHDSVVHGGDSFERAPLECSPDYLGVESRVSAMLGATWGPIPRGEPARVRHDVYDDTGDALRYAFTALRDDQRAKKR